MSEFCADPTLIDVLCSSYTYEGLGKVIGLCLVKNRGKIIVKIKKDSFKIKLLSRDMII